MEQRVLDNWLDSYIEYAKESETPELFHKWAAVSTLAAATARKIWLKFQYVTLYTNFWILLVAPPGTCRKGDAIRISRQLCDTCDRIIMSSESLTREKLISEFAAARSYYYRKMLNSGMTQEQAEKKAMAALTVHSSEFHVFMGQSDSRFMSDLTDLFDCHDKWQYGTIGRGDTVLTKVWLNILGATTPLSITEFMPQAAVGGGFLSRFILVAKKEKERLIPLVDLKDSDEGLFNKLSHDLNLIARLEGRVTLDEKAKEWYREWYSDFSETSMDEQDHRLTHYLARRPAHMLKLAAIMSIARDSTLVITKQDIIRAHHLLQEAEATMHIALSAFGKNKYAGDVESIKDYIKRNGTVLVKNLIKTFIKELSTADIYECLHSLTQAEQIKKTRTSKGIAYRYIGDE